MWISTFKEIENSKFHHYFLFNNIIEKKITQKPICLRKKMKKINESWLNQLLSLMHEKISRGKAN